MAIIAKGMITLTNVNDAYSVSTTPNVCAIKADFDGTNPILSDAYCDIAVLRGDVKVPFTIESIASNPVDIGYQITGDSYNKRFTLTSIPVNISSGSITIEINTEDGFVANAVFQYNVMREATMLDWIQDWETNKTSVGNTYLITPKLFVGKKVLTEEDLSVLTGVYIGPDSDKGAGIYGLKEGIDVFHINEEGAMVGGWTIAPGGIQTVDGTLSLSSDGSIVAKDNENNAVWGIYKSGEATFAKGNVQFHADGSAEFKGKITSSEGTVAGWTIDDEAIKSSIQTNSYVHLNAAGQYIELYNNNIMQCYEALDCNAFQNAERGGGYSSKIRLSASSGMIEISSLDAIVGGNIPKTYISPFGIHANYSGLKANGDETTKHFHYAAIVGIGSASKSKSGWEESGEESCVVGVYGKAKNTSSAPAYGGYFENLKACGLVLSKRVITNETTAMLQIESNETLIVSVANTGDKTITLPTENIDGKIVIVQRLGGATLTVTTDTTSGHLLGVPSVGGAYSLEMYECVMFILTAYRENDTVKYAWTINKFSNLGWGN